MSDDMISKPRARRIRLLCQAAAVICVGAAVAAVLLGVPLLRGPAAEPIAFTQVEDDSDEIYQSIMARRTDSEVTAEEFPPDTDLIAETLAMIPNAPKAPTPETGPEDEPETKTEVAAASGAKTRFVGTVGIGDRLLALVSAGGAQRILGEGDEAMLPLADGDSGAAPKVEIRSVTRQAVLLVEDGTERRIERAARTGFAVSTSVATVSGPADSGPNQPAGRPNSAFASTEDIKPVNPDDFRREDGTIDYEALREAARERARQRQDLRRQRRDANGEEN